MAQRSLRSDHPGARRLGAVRRNAGARRPRSRRQARRDSRLRRPLRRRQIGADPHHHRTGAETERPDRGVRHRPRHRQREGAALGRAALGHPVPAGRAVLLAERAAEHPVPGARISQSVAAADGRDHGRQARHGRAEAGGRGQDAVGTVRRHDQARGAGARAGARSGTGVPRRADLRPRSDRRRRFRRTGPHAAAHFGADGFHGNPRPRQPSHRLRPDRRARRRQDHRGRIDGRDESFAASVAAVIFSRQARPRVSAREWPE